MSPKKIQKLTEKKHRTEAGLFLVEGDKNIRELLSSELGIVELLGTKAFLAVIRDAVDAYTKQTGVSFPVREVEEAALLKMGSLLSNNAGIAVVQQKKEAPLADIIAEAQRNIVVLLDDVRDPGNMGTIIRTADWYGVRYIVASPTTTDFYNTKVISASMGSFTRCAIAYLEVETVLTEARKHDLPVIVADLAGENTHTRTLPQKGFLLMGSESHGVSDTARSFATDRVMIPRFGEAESLNVSVATAILLDSIRRG